MDNEKLKHKQKEVRSFIAEGKTLHAIQILESLIEDDAVDEIYFQLAELYESMGFVESGKNVLFNLIEKFPDDTDSKLFCGQYLLRNSAWFEAIEVLNHITKSNPPALFLIGYSYMMLNEFELSKEYFQKYIASNNDKELNQEANLYLAKIEYQLNHYDAALKYAKKAQFLYSDFWELNLILAKVYYSMGMFTHAVKPIQKAIQLNPKDSSIIEFAGKIYYKLEDYNKAEHYFSKFVEMNSEVSAEIYTLLAKSFLKQRKNEEAKLFFELALHIDPEYSPAISGKKELS